LIEFNQLSIYVFMPGFIKLKDFRFARFSVNDFSLDEALEYPRLDSGKYIFLQALSEKFEKHCSSYRALSLNGIVKFNS